uniref:CSON006735 protein n=1 Tax=Culicoides sonorensis TaxID=179676 RepID=A0A336KLY7_CULSO
MSLYILINHARNGARINRQMYSAIIAQQENYRNHHRQLLQQQQIQLRFNSSTSKEKTGSKLANYSESEDADRNNVRGYLFGRFFNYVQNYDKVIEKRYPKAVHVYRVFMTGVKEFFKDMKRFMKITKIANDAPEGLRVLNRSEIECYYHLPKDMFKIAPTLIISALPLMNYVVFPLAYMYPRVFLTTHFWTEKQKDEFRVAYMRERLIYNKPIFRILQARLDLLKKTDENREEYEKLNEIFGHLGSGTHPLPEEIIAIKSIFTKTPYNLESLGSRHLTYLCYLYSLHTWPGKRGRLAERSYLVHHMDLAINREGGAHNMTTEALRHSCYLRGLNPTNLSDEEMKQYLTKWVQVSEVVDGDSVSLYLHLPILLAYNHPNNWKLIH